VPPWPWLVCGLEAGLADELVGLWLDVDPDVPGVSGPPEAVRAIAAAWTRRTAGKTRRSMEEAMHRGRGYASSAVAAASEWGR
jgi:hypothetical protein